jgi:hypothetical protein
MKIIASTDMSQRVFIVILNDTTDISAQTSFAIKIFSDPLQVAIKSYTLSDTELTYLKENRCIYLPTLQIFSTFPADGYYYCQLTGNSITSDMNSVVFTQTVRGVLYSKLSLIDVYSPDYNISTLLHTAKMMLDEMEVMQYLEYSTQKKVDFDLRLQTLNQIL